MSKHTPGPWFLCREGLKGKSYSIQTQEWGTTHPLPEADARLIAAAPDMLAALKAIMDHLHFAFNEDDINSSVIDAYDEAKAAIAKAEGVS